MDAKGKTASSPKRSAPRPATKSITSGAAAADKTPEAAWEAREDPSEEFTDRSRVSYASLTSEFGAFADQLQATGMLVIASAHSGLAAGACTLMAGASQLRSARPRVLIDYVMDFSRLLSQKERWRIGATAEEPGGKNVVLRIRAFTQEHLEQVSKLLTVRNQHGFDSSSNFFVIIEIIEEAWSGLKQHKLSGPVWRIDARKHLLLHHQYDEAAAAALLIRLESARRNANWPTGECEFVLWLEERLIERNLEQCLDEPATAEALSGTGASLAAVCNKVEKCALFVAAMFPQLTMGEFDILVRLLAKAEKIQAPALPGQPLPPAEDGQAHWLANQEEIYGKLGLEHRAEAGPMTVDFQKPSMRESVRKALFPPANVRALKQLYASGILGDPRRSRTTITRLIDITVEQAQNNEDDFDRHWLMSVYQCQEAAEVAGTSAHQRAVQRRNNFLQLCRCFLLNRQTLPAVTGFLEDLIQDTQPDGIEALEIVARLADSEGYEPGKHFFHLLNCSHARVRVRIMRRLLAQMFDRQKNPMPAQGFTIINMATGWFPDHAADASIGTGHRWALAFLYSLWEDYRDWSIRQGALEHDVPVPWLVDSEEAPPVDDRLAQLGQWFSHPHLASCMEEVIRTMTVDLQSETLGTLHWDLMKVYYHPRSVGEALMADALSGFYLYSGDERWLQVVDHLRVTLDRKVRENLQALIRQLGDIPLDEASRASRALDAQHKVHVKRAYQLAQRLLTEPTNPALPS